MSNQLTAEEIAEWRMHCSREAERDCNVRVPPAELTSLLDEVEQRRLDALSDRGDVKSEQVVARWTPLGGPVDDRIVGPASALIVRPDGAKVVILSWPPDEWMITKLIVRGVRR